MSIKCSNCGLVSFAENQDCRRCGMPIGQSSPGGWYGEPQNPGSIVDPPPSYGGEPVGNEPPQGWAPPTDGYGGGYAGGAGAYGNAGYGSQQAYGGTHGTYAPPYGQYGGYAPSFGYGAIARPYDMADRGTRLVAAILDTVCLYGPLLVGVMLGVMVGDAAILVGVLLGLAGLLAVAIVQIVMLCQRGQTIGKRALGIRIVKMDTGENGGGVTNVLLRGFVPGLLGMVPYIGPLFSIVNICFIFAADKRCVHDHIASTVVVRGDP